MSNSQIEVYDVNPAFATEVTVRASDNEILTFLNPNSAQTCHANLAHQQTEEGSDQCDSGDSGESSLIPIYSVNETYLPNESEKKAKRECSPPIDDEGGRKRVKFQPQHIKILEEVFLNSQYPTTEVKEKLEEQLGVSENRILIWFQNRRAKEKREVKRLQKIRSLRKQIDSKLQPPPFWPEDLSFTSPLRHIPLSERQIKQAEVFIPTTPLSEEDRINFIPQNIQARVPVLAAQHSNQQVLSFAESNPACSFHNGTFMIPPTNQIQYTPVDTVYPMTTAHMKSLTFTKTFQPYTNQQHAEPAVLESPQWEEQLYTNQNTINYACNYLPVGTQFQSYPWFGSAAIVQNQRAPVSICQTEQFVPNCDANYCNPCKPTY